VAQCVPVTHAVQHAGERGGEPTRTPRDSGPGSRLIAWLPAGAFVASYKAYAPGFKQPMHEHAIAAMDLNVRGGGVGAYHRTQRVSRAGEVEYFHAGVGHSFVAGAKGIRTLHLTFAPELVREIAPSISPDATPDQPAAVGAAASILQELLDPDRSSAMIVEESALRMLNATSRSTGLEKRAPRWIAQACDLLADASLQTFSLAELADQLGVERAHLARTFKRHTGQTCGEHHRRARIAAALRLLAEPDVSVSRVAHQTGFADQAHLTRWCRRLSGWTPAALASLLREGTPGPMTRARPHTPRS